MSNPPKQLGSHGIILLNKPVGVTSFKALNPLKQHFKGQKLGHSGTLDQFAEGLCVVLVGSMTKLNPYFTHLDKIYHAQLTFGTQTTTLDPEGEVESHGPLPTLASVKAALRHFVGGYNQAPPSYSAIHIDGKRAYERVRAGETVNMVKRPVQLYEVKLGEFTGDASAVQTLNITLTCGSGFYVRSFARDLAEAAGSCAYLTALTRSAIGRYNTEGVSWRYTLEAAVLSENFNRHKHLIAPYEAVTTLDGVVRLAVGEEVAAAVRHGKPFQRNWLTNIKWCEDATYLLFNEDQLLLASVVCENGRWGYGFVVASA